MPAAQLVAGLSFGAPLVLSGLALAAAPWLAHLLLRPRPTRVRFPAITLLREAVAAGDRARRLHDRGLMLLRAAALAALVLLLARPRCAPLAPSHDGSELQVLLIDDSFSMRYRLADGASPLELALADASAFVSEAPERAALAVVWSDPTHGALQPTANHREVLTHLRSAKDARPHACSLRHAVASAAELLARAEHGARRLILYTDLCEHAWRDVPAAALAGLDPLRVELRASRPAPAGNLAVLDVQAPAAPAIGAQVPFAATLLSQGLGSVAWLSIHEGERELARLGPIELAANQPAEVRGWLAPLPAGPHGLEARVEPTDRLNFDQTRSFAIEVGEAAVVWLVAGDAHDPAAMILRNLLAPERLPPARRALQLQVRGVEAVSALAAVAGAERAPALVVLMSDAPASAELRRSLRAFVERGGVALLAPAARDRGALWGATARFLSEGPARLVELPGASAMRWERGSRFRASGAGAQELTRCAALRRIDLGALVDGAVVHARLDDGAPLIVERALGAGRFLLLAVAPDPQSSDLGLRAAALLTWLHAVAREAHGRPQGIANVLVGDELTGAFAPLDERGVELTGPDFERVFEPGDADRRWPTRSSGVYLLRTDGNAVPAGVYCANWPPEESDLSPVTPERVSQFLGVDSMTVISLGSGAASAPPESAHTAWRRPEFWIAGLLAGLALLEAWLSAGPRRILEAAP